MRSEKVGTVFLGRVGGIEWLIYLMLSYKFKWSRVRDQQVAAAELRCGQMAECSFHPGETSSVHQNDTISFVLYFASAAVIKSTFYIDVEIM